VSDPAEGSVVAGRLYPLWFDGTVFRLPPQRYDKASWGLCAGQNCAAGETVAVPYIAVVKSEVSKCHIAAGTAPAGADLIVDILKNGVSIFGATKLVLSANQESGATTSFANRSLSEGDRLTAVVTQVGATVPGADISIACRLEL